MAEAQGTLVQFTADVSPHCKGDIVRLTSSDLKAIDEIVKKRDIDTPYRKYEAPKAESGK